MASFNMKACLMYNFRLKHDNKSASITISTCSVLFFIEMDEKRLSDGQTDRPEI